MIQNSLMLMREPSNLQSKKSSKTGLISRSWKVKIIKHLKMKMQIKMLTMVTNLTSPRRRKVKITRASGPEERIVGLFTVKITRSTKLPSVISLPSRMNVLSSLLVMETKNQFL
uniref:Uncharacterized protein n=1 Tax=Cacopsylla melanoneura TaxID=428564 RepID=A0A8D8V922_9HEMI